MKQREVEYKTRELDRERARLMTVRDNQRDLTRRESPTALSRPQYSYSTTHLVPPESPSQSQHNRPNSRPVSPGGAIPVDQTSYAPPLVRPRTGSKPKGWIRRLSMPVISSLDSSSKKPNVGISSAQWNASRQSLETAGRSYRG